MPAGVRRSLQRAAQPRYAPTAMYEMPPSDHDNSYPSRFAAAPADAGTSMLDLASGLEIRFGLVLEPVLVLAPASVPALELALVPVLVLEHAHEQEPVLALVPALVPALVHAREPEPQRQQELLPEPEPGLELEPEPVLSHTLHPWTATEAAHGTCFASGH